MTRLCGPESTDSMQGALLRLAAGATRHTSRDAAARARLALECAARVAAEADAWAQTAVAVKQPGSVVGKPGMPAGRSALAEEMATGPLATLRLLVITARALADIGRGGLPQARGPLRLAHSGAGIAGAARIEVDVMPAPGLFDSMIFRGHSATVRCVNPGGIDAFTRVWQLEAQSRPRSGGAAVVLGAGNVTGLAAADCICQIFEHGRASLLKLHPLHAPLEPVLRRALAPLIEAGLLEIITGDAEVARAAASSSLVTHVHLTGGQAAFDALVWGGRDPHAPDAMPVLAKSITCELGNVTPWIVVPGNYTPAQLACQADTVAASIANNTSFNCIATKMVVTCRSWPQRDAFLGLVARRLASLPARPAWYPGAAAAWQAIAGGQLPADGTLPWVFRTGIDIVRQPEWIAREWFVPVAAETAIDADDIEAFCTRASGLTHSLPGSLAASVTAPGSLSPRDRERVELLLEHLEYGVVALNGWSALAYALGSVPWGGFPGGTLAAPASGIGRVHDPLLLPLVHNSIIRAPLVAWPEPPWFPWSPRGPQLARGLVALYAAIARGEPVLWPLARMLPDVILSAVCPAGRP